MRISYLNLVVMIVVSGLLSWGACAIQSTLELRPYMACATFIALAITGIGGMAVSYEKERSSVVIKTMCMTSFFIIGIMDYVFSFFAFNIPLFIILNTLIVLVVILIGGSVNKTKM